MAKSRKRLPWSYYETLGWGGKKVDEKRARQIVERHGLDAVSDHGDTPLTVAAQLGRASMVRWLLKQGADVNDVAPHEHGKPALCAAAYGKQADVAALLVAAGASIEAPDSFGNTALANAFINCFTDPLPLATVLMDLGAALTDHVHELGLSWNAAAFRAFRNERVDFKRSWLTWRERTIPKLAQAACDKRKLARGRLDASKLAILADALEEAGCSDQHILGHLRGPGPHLRACWVLDLLLGKE